jgi:hypothetical protein
MADQISRDYDSDDQVDLPGYAASIGSYAAVLSTLLLVGRRRGTRLPKAYNLQDVVLGGVAVHKFSRLLSKSSVMSPVRAPFTSFEQASGSAEHVEEPHGEHGLRHTLGELLTCPFCLGVWVGSGYVAALGLAPREARAWAALFTITFISDTLQLGYDALREL